MPDARPPPPKVTPLRTSTLQRFTIPGCEEKLIATLLADDTTAFLSANDDFETLQNILDEWRIAAKAKFNIAKTEIIPIGKKRV